VDGVKERAQLQLASLTVEATGERYQKGMRDLRHDG
jgi:hypothetical protein